MFPSTSLSRCAYVSHNVTIQVPSGHPSGAWQYSHTQRYSKSIQNDSRWVSSKFPRTRPLLFFLAAGRDGLSSCLHITGGHPIRSPACTHQHPRRQGSVVHNMMHCTFVGSSWGAVATHSLNIFSPQDCNIHSFCIGINGRKRFL